MHGSLGDPVGIWGKPKEVPDMDWRGQQMCSAAERDHRDRVWGEIE